MPRSALVLLLLLLAPLSLAAQTVRGTVVEEGGGAPVSRAMVLLLDTDGRTRAGALTGEDGRFTLAAPAPGTYVLRAERVGHASVVSPTLALAAGETVEQRLVAPAQVVTLEGISVRGGAGARRCEVRPGAGAAAATLWEEARKALNAAAWARDARQFTYEVVRYDRELDPNSLEVTREQRRTSTVVSTHPFASIPADSLSRRGFVQEAHDGTTYYAPDAHVLLSDAFLNDHCFHVAEDGPEGLVGLAFEPVRGRSVPDVRGVFWLDRKTAELRWLEYGYVRLRTRVGTEKLGGRVEFERLPSGAWFVKNWSIRMPLISVEAPRYSELSGSTVGSGGREWLTGIYETGGEVKVAQARVTGPTRLALAGSVYDSLRAAPLAGAEVFLSGTALRATTGPDGRFRLEDVPEGEYSVSFTHPALPGLGLALPVRTVAVRQGATPTVELAVPSAATVARAVCPAAGRGTAAVVGAVRGPTGEPVRDARVVLRWRPGSSGRTEAVTDAQGAYRACGVPSGARLAAEVSSPGLAPGRTQVTLAPGALAVLEDLRAGDPVRLGADGRPIPLEGVRVTARTRPPAAADRMRITEEEIAGTGVNNALEVVQRLRPDWTRIRGMQSMSMGTRGRTGEVSTTELVPATEGEGERLVTRRSVAGASQSRDVKGVQAVAGMGQSEIVVYLDSQKLGGIEELRHVHTTTIASIEYLDGPSATIRYGTGHSQGAIVISTKLGQK